MATTAGHTGAQFTEQWVGELAKQPGVSPVLTAGALVTKAQALPADHMVRSAATGV